MALRGREDLSLYVAVEDGVGRLLGVDPLEAAALGDPLRLDDVGCGGRGGPDGPDLATADEVRERGERLLDVRVRIRSHQP